MPLAEKQSLPQGGYQGLNHGGAHFLRPRLRKMMDAAQLFTACPWARPDLFISVPKFRRRKWRHTEW
eukprot:10226171-Alexandrium_andersonii.AAC.1